MPDFLCIGAQRGGTTWLDHALRQHRQLWMPPLKELHYFDCSVRTPLVLHILARQTTSGRRARMALQLLRRPQHVRWAGRYLLWPRNDRWYAGLFRPAPGQLSGEATPAYAMLERPTIAALHGQYPALRIIYLLRDPLQRLWSQVGRFITKHTRADIATISDADIYALVRQNFAAFHAHSSYLANLARWESIFAPRQIFVGFFGQVHADPAALLTALYAFLGVDAQPGNVPGDAGVPRNARRFRPMPAEIGRWLAEQLHSELVALHQRFDNADTAQWLADAERRIERS
jgi:hypothetical protein